MVSIEMKQMDVEIDSLGNTLFPHKPILESKVLSTYNF